MCPNFRDSFKLNRENCWDTRAEDLINFHIHTSVSITPLVIHHKELKQRDVINRCRKLTLEERIPHTTSAATGLTPVHQVSVKLSILIISRKLEGHDQDIIPYIILYSFTAQHEIKLDLTVKSTNIIGVIYWNSPRIQRLA
ncbi:hypothetical protein DPMN_176589 [Dreissena polymorpha]|uniref:Uncharacterized protein n=1 Tax=Dreissena polymorpha TaxID=45954 RepID=A0A9D4II78_DREPO|nr:hypothetical protein DPMN_176589 [Dreissena polymorpha]